MERLMQNRVEQFQESILSWGTQNRRDFPWRKDLDSFHVLVAEFLLQRSRSKTVATAYTKLFSRWPSFLDLAEASISDISDVIGLLGLKKRATNLKGLAKAVKERGSVPDSEGELRQLPGVGRYIANATLVTAFEKNIPLTDSVTMRLYRRYFGLGGCMSSTCYSTSINKTDWDFLSKIMTKQVKELNWSVLDLAASICLPRVPRCPDCPLESSCSYVKTRDHMRVAELFAGVGGFRLGLESGGWQTVWSNQWEPKTSRQYASECYISHFGSENHICEDIEKVLDEIEHGKGDIPDFTLLVGGFPCQDYSVARTLSQATGIQGKKGILWWQIHRLVSMKKPPLIFLENVDRLLNSPASQRGRDFAIMLACLSDLGYLVEWRIVNAADYGFPQKRRRVFIVGKLVSDDYILVNPIDWLKDKGILAKALPVKYEVKQPNLSSSGMTLPDFRIEGDIPSVSDHFGKKSADTPFQNSGVVYKRDVWTRKVLPDYERKRRVLNDVLLDDSQVDESFFIPESQLEKWKYLKGAKNEERVHKASGFTYNYNEGGIPFPDNLDGPARTILTAEGGSIPSRFKHIILLQNGRYRRLTPVELERLNGFPDDWTSGIPDTKRAFLMGNALVVGIIERVGKVLADKTCEEVAAFNL